MRSKPGLNAVRIGYCGPIARPGHPARGGYESANRRLIDDLRLRHCEVLEFAYPVTSGPEALKLIGYLLRFAGITLELIQQRSQFEILHLTPLYGRFLYPEALLFLAGWILGKRVLLDIRAGCFVRLYRERSSLYRALVNSLVRRAHIVAIEGREDLAFVKARRRGPIVHLPNYVNELSSEKACAPGRDRSPLHLVHFGRIVPEKGIELTIDTLKTLLSMGLEAKLEVIGSGHQDYVEKLQKRTKDLPVIWNGALPTEEARTRLAQAHFFVFPTRHFGEGHSNALTEAMAEGVVPICSEHGFNRSVVADTGYLLPNDASALDYAETIATIWNSGAWPRLSVATHQRVLREFTSDVALAGLIQHYGRSSY
jgi:glycosyltransferase involved in cell wall biosynthesis